MGNLGDRLRDARQRQQLSLDDVEAATKIRKIYLIALEQEDYARLPALVYAKGFLRTYASFLGLDADAILEMLPEPTSSPALEPATQLQKLPRAIGSWFVAAIIIAMVGAVGAYLYQQSPPSTPDPPVVIIEIPTPTPQPTAIPSPTAKVYADTVEVQLRAVERTWIAVTVDSQAVFTGTLEIGDNFMWAGRERVQMRIGNAGGLDISLNGQKKGLLGRPGDVLSAEFTMEGYKILPTTQGSPPRAPAP